MAAGQRRLRQVDGLLGILVAQAAGRGREAPVAAAGKERRRDGLGAPFQQRENLRLLLPDDAGDARLHDAGLLAGDGFQRGAEELLVVEGDRRDRSEEHTSELQSLLRISYAV